MSISTLTSKGQTTIPREVRDAAGLRTGDRLHFTVLDDGTIILRVKNRSIRDLHIKQGGTVVLRLATEPGIALGGQLVDHQLHFVAADNGEQIALHGVHALVEPGTYPLRIEATFPDGSRWGLTTPTSTS